MYWHALGPSARTSGGRLGTECMCKQGYFGPINNGGVDCQVCLANTYTSSIGMSACSLCPDESQSDTGSTQVTDCVCGRRFYMQDSLCQSCDKGKYKADPGNTQDLCVSCTEGTYSDAKNSSVCLPCTPNSQSGAFSTSASDCTCDAGFNYTCVGCAPGTYQKDTAQSGCDACPVGSNSSAQSTQKASCRCTFSFTGANGGPFSRQIQTYRGKRYTRGLPPKLKFGRRQHNTSLQMYAWLRTNRRCMSGVPCKNVPKYYLLEPV